VGGIHHIWIRRLTSFPSLLLRLKTPSLQSEKIRSPAGADLPVLHLLAVS
jgi:hypothetical protein